MSNTISTNGLTIGLFSALCAGLVSAIGFALNAPLFALHLADDGVSQENIGLALAIAGSAAVLCTPLVPILMGRISIRPLLAIILVGNAALFAAYPYLSGPIMWTAARFLSAALLTLIFVISESWILSIAPASHRGRILALYAGIFAGGFGIGGAIIGYFGYKDAITPLCASLASMFALIPLALPSAKLERPSHDSARPSAMIARIKVVAMVFVPALAMGAIETAAFNLFPLWNRLRGFDDSVAGYLIAASGLGNIILQGPIGFAADHWGRKRAMGTVAFVGVVGPILLAATGSPFSAYITVFFWSGAVTGLYTLGLMGLAERFSGNELPAANATYAASYGVGQMAAPLLGGYCLAVFGANGLMGLLSFMALLPIAALLYQWKKSKETHAN